MKFVLTSNDTLQLQEVDDNEVLADSQLDYPGVPNGWSFEALNKDGSFSPLLHREVDAELSTKDGFRVGRDGYCFIGRDFAHPGYDQQPTLVWVAPQSCVVDLSIETSALFPNTRSSAKLSLRLDGSVVDEQLYRFPEICRLHYRLNLVQGHRVELVFGTEHIIDNLVSLYYAWIVDAENEDPCDGPPVVAARVAKEISKDWQDVYGTLAAYTGARDQDLLRIAHDPFKARYDMAEQQKKSAVGLFEQLEEGGVFGEPRYFSTARKYRS